MNHTSHPSPTRPDEAVRADDAQALSRRQLLRGGAAMAAWAGLAGCGALPAAQRAGPRIVRVEFIGMPPPATDAQRAQVSTSATVRLYHADGSVREQPLAYHRLYQTGDWLPGAAGAVVAGGYRDIQGQPLIDNSGAVAGQAYSDSPDGQSLLSVPGARFPGVQGHTLFLVTQFEYRTASNGARGARPAPKANAQYGHLPGQIAVATLDQNPRTGALHVVQYRPVDLQPIHGLWMPCAASLSPWNTHLSSEEYEPDAVHAASDKAFVAFSRHLFGDAAAANPYHYGHVPEVTVLADGTARVVKHYGMGRIARELVQVMPDERTVLMGDDGTDTGLFMFVADRPRDLSAGSLYVAQWLQIAGTDGGAARLSWIWLGHATSAQVEALANRLQPSQIVSVHRSNPGDVSFTPIAYNGKKEWVRFVPGQELAAAFLETHRYAAALGGSLEFTKMEGVSLNARDKVAYVAMSYIQRGMSDGLGDITVQPITAGAVYELALSAGQHDTGGAPIPSDWVPSRMAAIPALVGEDLATPDALGNTAHVDKLSNPDNLKFSPSMRTLFIGEDSSQHVNNFLWAYHVDTKKLARILSIPAGAESTGLQVVENLNGFAYLMSNFQHAGDWLPIHAGVKDALDPLVNASFRDKQSAAVGYLSGLPAFRR